MSILIMKFGGASVSNERKIKDVANIIFQRRKKFPKIVVIVSAMGNMTDQLLRLARKISRKPSPREQDMLITVGERISISLLAMALLEKKMEAISFTGSQSGIITTSTHFDAKIIDVKPSRILQSLQEKKTVIVAGFQGVSKEKEITSLGRGGSDTTAVALATALNAEKVEFYKDVDGMYTEDPKKNKQAKKYEQMGYEKALFLAKKGAKILHPRAIELAWKNGICLHLLSYKNFKKEKGTMIFEKRKKRKKLFFEISN